MYLSDVILCINIKHRQNGVVNEPSTQSERVQRVGSTAATLQLLLRGSESTVSHLVNTGAIEVSNYSQLS